MIRKAGNVTVHMVMSLDGFISRKDESIEWMHSTDRYQKGIKLTDELTAQYLSSIDCYLMGSRTYEHAVKLGWAYGDTPVYVLSNRDLHPNKQSVNFCSGDLQKVVQDLSTTYQSIWMVGGSEVARELLKKDLADQLVVTITPVLLGDGKPFFDQIGKENRLHLIDTIAFNDGMVELTYEIIKNTN